MLLKKPFEHVQLTKFQNFRGKKLSSLINTFSFPGSSRNIKKALSSRTSPGRLLLKLIYWNESIQRINIIITTDEYQEQPPTIIEKFARRQLWGGIWFQKSWYHSLAWIFFPRVVWILSQLTASVLKLQQQNVLGQKSTVWKTALVPQYLLSGMLSTIFSCEYFRYFR